MSATFHLKLLNAVTITYSVLTKHLYKINKRNSCKEFYLRGH